MVVGSLDIIKSRVIRLNPNPISFVYLLVGQDKGRVFAVVKRVIKHVLRLYLVLWCFISKTLLDISVKMSKNATIRLNVSLGCPRRGYSTIAQYPPSRRASSSVLAE